MNSRSQNRYPEPHAQHEVQNRLRNSQLQHDRNEAENYQTHKQRRPVQRAAVENRDHQDGTDVVGDGQRQQKDLQVRGNPFHHSQHAQRESDIGCHRNAPAVMAVVTVIQRGK